MLLFPGLKPVLNASTVIVNPVRAVFPGLVLSIELLLSSLSPDLAADCSLLICGYTLNTFLYKLGLTVTFLSTVLVFPQRSVAV